MDRLERRADLEFKELKAQLLAMGGSVERALEHVTQALLDRDANKLVEVRSIEKKINEYHIDVDNRCCEVLARQGPVASDLRWILAVIKINADLERMGDQAMNVTYNLEHFFNHRAIQVDVELGTMARKVQVMVRDSLDAFVRLDTNLAEKVLESDDEIDGYKNRAFATLLEHMKAHPSQIEAALDLILVARNLERMADHATNIAEDVIFAGTGEDVRHGVRLNANAKDDAKS